MGSRNSMNTGRPQASTWVPSVTGVGTSSDTGLAGLKTAIVLLLMHEQFLRGEELNNGVSLALLSGTPMPDCYCGTAVLRTVGGGGGEANRPHVSNKYKTMLA